MCPFMYSRNISRRSVCTLTSEIYRINIPTVLSSCNLVVWTNCRCLANRQNWISLIWFHPDCKITSCVCYSNCVDAVLLIINAFNCHNSLQNRGGWILCMFPENYLKAFDQCNALYHRLFNPFCSYWNSWINRCCFRFIKGKSRRFRSQFTPTCVSIVWTSHCILRFSKDVLYIGLFMFSVNPKPMYRRRFYWRQLVSAGNVALVTKERYGLVYY